MKNTRDRKDDDDDTVDEPPAPPPPASSPADTITTPRTTRASPASSSAVDTAATKCHVPPSPSMPSSSSRRPGAESVTAFADSSSGGRAGVRAAIAGTEGGRLASPAPSLASRKSNPECPPVASPPRTPPSMPATSFSASASKSASRKRRLMDVGGVIGAISEGGEDDFRDEEDPYAHGRSDGDAPHQSDLPHAMPSIPMIEVVATPSVPAIEVVAMPVEDGDFKDGRRRRNPFMDWRVLVLVIVAVGVIVGLVTAIVMKNRFTSQSGGEGEDSKGPIRDDVQVNIDPFSMELASDGVVDGDELVDVTTSHLTKEMVEAFSEVKSLDLTVKLEEVHRGQRLRRLDKTTTALFQGFMMIEGGMEFPTERAVRDVRDGAFSGSKLDDFLRSANQALGVTSAAVFDEDGEELGSVNMGDGGGSEPSEPTPSPTTTTEAPIGGPTSPTQEPTTSPENGEGGGTKPTPAVPTPTDAPTDVPTTTPTDAPTHAPTTMLSDTSTHAPTTVLTDTPTDAPTTTPTDAPTDAPTTTPTDAPTTTPTDAPTATPTDAPTATPTDAPTDAPTTTPTDAPTHAPTTTPTTAPAPDPTTTPQVPIPEPGSSPAPPPPSTPYVLSTPLNWKFSRPGAMFDVVNKGSSAVSITSLDVHITSSGSNIPVEIWTKSGSYDGYESNQGAWTELNPGSGFVIPRGRGEGELSRIPKTQFEPIPLDPGARMAFYVTLLGNKGMLMGQGNGLVSDDENLLIEAGASLRYRFGSVNKGKIWNGAVRYEFAL